MIRNCILRFLCAAFCILIHTIQTISMNSSIAYHVKVENQTRHIYITPLAIFFNNQTTFVFNTSTNRVTMTIPVILYNNDQIEFVHENNSNECSNHNTNCIFHEIPGEMMRLVNKSEDNQPNLLDCYHRYVHHLWISVNSLSSSRLLNVHFDCKSNESCVNLEFALHQSTTLSGLYLEYAINELEPQQMIISDKHRLETKIHLSEFILENNVEEFLEYLLHIANIHDNEEYILSQIDLSELKKILRVQLLGKTLYLTAENNENQWNNLYWKDAENIRPDRLLKLLNMKIKPRYLVRYDFDSDDIDRYVRQTYQIDGYNLYLKHRHLFQLEKKNLTLKPMLTYELKKYKRSTFLVHQPVHKLKQDDIHSLPIYSFSTIEKMQIKDKLLINNIKNYLTDSTTNNNELSTTDESSQYEAETQKVFIDNDHANESEPDAFHTAYSDNNLKKINVESTTIELIEESTINDQSSVDTLPKNIEEEMVTSIALPYYDITLIEEGEVID